MLHLAFSLLVVVAQSEPAPPPTAAPTVAPVVDAPGAMPADPAEAAADPPAALNENPTDELAPLRERQRELLQKFSDGEQVPTIPGLFVVELDDAAAVKRRIGELEARELEPESADRLRLELLRNWNAVFGDMNAPAQRAFAELHRPRRALTATAARLDAVEAGLVRLSSALRQQIDRAESGGLVGFRPDIAEWAAAAELTRATARRASTRARSTRAEIEAEARELTQKTRKIRQHFLAAGLRRNQAALDEVFLQTIERQRRIELSRRKIEVSSVDDEIARLGDALPTLAAAVDRVRDVSDARVALGRADTLLGEVKSTLERAKELPGVFERTAIREAMTLLLPVASAQARAEAYPLGFELVGELRTELELLVERMSDGVAERIGGLRAEGTLQRSVPRAMVVLVLVFLTWVVQARAPRLVVPSVRALLRSRFYWGKAGALVRWAGLLQAVAPVLAVGAGGYAVLAVLRVTPTEARFLETAFRYLWLYWLGRELLAGSVRRVGAGRPALIDVPPETAEQLRRSYNSLALAVALGFMVEEWARTVFALGRLRMVIDLLVALWALGWVAHACFRWRESVARALGERFGDRAAVRKLAAWMERRWLGVTAVVPGVVVLLVAGVVRVIKSTLLHQGVFAYLKARALRRQSSSAEQPGGEEVLPEAYVAEFPLYPVLGEVDSVLVPRATELDPILAQIKDWRESRRASSLALVGEKGLGKTTMLAALERRLSGIEVSSTTLDERLATPEDAARQISRLFSFEDPQSLEELGAALNDGPDRIAIVDDAHLSFLRVVGGYRGFDALVQLVNLTGERVFWILSFNDFAWSFLNAAHGGRAYFRRVQWMKRWSAEELRDLLGRRTRKAGYELEFDEQLLDDDRVDAGGMRLVEGADGFFRMLWESSRGNPRAATWQWLRALSFTGGKTLRVQLVSAPRSEALQRANDDVFFALSAIAQHENLSENELQETLNVDPSLASYVLRYLNEYGIVGAKFGAADRYTIKVRHYWDVIQALRARNLLFREATS